MSSEIPTAYDIVRENTTRIMNKVDSQIPFYIKMGSDIYTEYLHTVEDMLEVGYKMEQAELNTLFSDAWSRKALQQFASMYSGSVLMNLEVYGQFLKWYSGMRVSGMQSVHKATRNYMEMMDAHLKGPGAATTPPSGDPGDARKAAPRPKRASKTAPSAAKASAKAAASQAGKAPARRGRRKAA